MTKEEGWGMMEEKVGWRRKGRDDEGRRRGSDGRKGGMAEGEGGNDGRKGGMAEEDGAGVAEGEGGGMMDERAGWRKGKVGE